jgi:7-cyano-7-deazaguanine reductase
MSEMSLGKISEYKKNYAPEILFRIERKMDREKFGITTNFFGYDIWNCYELSWLDKNGKPNVRILEIYIPSTSEYIVESKSLKLYLFSLSNEVYDSETHIASVIKSDIEKNLESEVKIALKKLDFFDQIKLQSFEGICLDDLDFTSSDFFNKSSKPSLESEVEITEKFYSNLHKTNCLITSQPDYASIFIEYTGKKISKESILKYIVSFRDEDMFHEHSVEKIFNDIYLYCMPEELTVYARYTRRGGIDINPVRSSKEIDNIEKLNIRLARQ